MARPFLANASWRGLGAERGGDALAAVRACFHEAGDDQAFLRRAMNDAQGSAICRRPRRRRLLRYAPKPGRRVCNYTVVTEEVNIRGVEIQ